MPIRPLTEADIPQVADLYWHYLRLRKGPAPPGLCAVLRELCFESPFVDDVVHPIVFEAEDGRIGGFSGGMVRKMSAQGKTIRVTFGGSLVFHPDFRSGGIAPQLVKTFFAQDSDLGMVDSANNPARKVLLRNGFRIVPALNLHWMRALRPAHYGVYGLSRSTGPLVAAGLKLARPLCWVADSLAPHIAGNIFQFRTPSLHGSELDPETLCQCLRDSRCGYSLWTEYDLPSLQWLLGFMERRAARGTLRKILLRDDDGKIAGWYIYYVKPGAVGEVVQVGGSPDLTKKILDHLFYDAREQGMVGVHGVAEMRRMADFSDQHCFFTCRGGWTMARSSCPELLDLLDRDALFTRLDGEWCLDPGE
jgi:GNAT superfamily N-acetyltransferase